MKRKIINKSTTMLPNKKECIRASICEFLQIDESDYIELQKATATQYLDIYLGPFISDSENSLRLWKEAIRDSTSFGIWWDMKWLARDDAFLSKVCSAIFTDRAHDLYFEIHKPKSLAHKLKLPGRVTTDGFLKIQKGGKQ